MLPSVLICPGLFIFFASLGFYLCSRESIGSLFNGKCFLLTSFLSFLSLPSFCFHSALFRICLSLSFLSSNTLTLSLLFFLFRFLGRYKRFERRC